MIDIDLIREKPEVVEESARKRGQVFQVTEAAELDSRRRRTISEIDSLRATRNEVSRELGKKKEKPQDLIDEMREVGTQISRLEKKEKDIAEQLQNILMVIPNIPGDTTPLGADEGENVVVRTTGDKPEFDFDPKPHWDIGEDLGIIDFQRGVKVSQTRFYLLHNKGAMLQRAIISWMLGLHISQHGYSEYIFRTWLIERPSQDPVISHISKKICITMKRTIYSWCLLLKPPLPVCSVMRLLTVLNCL